MTEKQTAMVRIYSEDLKWLEENYPSKGLTATLHYIINEKRINRAQSDRHRDLQSSLTATMNAIRKTQMELTR